MAVRRRIPRRIARAGLVTAAVITVAGLLAMHALSLHGTSTDAELGMSSLPAAHVSHTHALEHAGHATGDRSGPVDHDMHPVMMVCVAFLLAAGTMLLIGLWRRTPSWRCTSISSRSRRTALPPLLTRHATGPPSVWAYSVIRC